jgi:prepilin-type processing-associated H-X9-DG protein
MWFCPARPEEYTSAATYNAGNQISTLADLNNYMYNLVGAPGLYVMNHNLWVVRGVIPATSGALPNTDPQTYGGFPQKSSDVPSKFIPFISDTCYSGYNVNTSLIGDGKVSDVNLTGASNFLPAHKYSGHVYNGRLASVNLVFVDGHVTLHSQNLIQGIWGNSTYLSGGGSAAGADVWFY